MSTINLTGGNTPLSIGAPFTKDRSMLAFIDLQTPAARATFTLLTVGLALACLILAGAAVMQ